MDAVDWRICSAQYITPAIPEAPRSRSLGVRAGGGGRRRRRAAAAVVLVLVLVGWGRGGWVEGMGSPSYYRPLPPAPRNALQTGYWEARGRPSITHGRPTPQIGG